MAAALKQAGIEDFLVVDRAGDLGGTWRDNTYPGLACDVPSNLYSFSFRPGPLEPPLPAAAGDPGLPARRWPPSAGSARTSASAPASPPPSSTSAARVWHLTLEDGGTLQATAVVSAVGQLGRPALPDIAGRDDFAGPSWHSARWDHDVDLTGKRVAVVGTGASAIQFVPEIAKTAAHVDVYQRSAPVCAAQVRPALSRRRARPLRPVPGRCARPTGCASSSTASCSPAASSCRRSCWPRRCRCGAASSRADHRPAAAREVRPRLRDGLQAGAVLQRLVPDAGPAATSSSITDPIERIVPGGVVTADGTTRPADVIIYGTGFQTLDFLAPMSVTGLGGRELQEAWRDGARGVPRDHRLGVPELLHALRAQHQPRRQLDHLHARRPDRLRARRHPGPRRGRASTGSTCGPRCSGRSTPGWMRPAAPRCGRAAATAGTPRPRAATPTTGPTTPSSTGTGSAASTSASTGSCRNGRPWTRPVRPGMTPRRASRRSPARTSPARAGALRLPPALARLGMRQLGRRVLDPGSALGGAAPAPRPGHAGLAGAAPARRSPSGC